jgi:hypothetical protein
MYVSIVFGGADRSPIVYINRLQKTRKMSFDSLSTLMSTIWYSLDDIFVCVGVFLAANVVAHSTEWCLCNYFKSSKYTAQTIHFAFLFAVGIFLIGHLIGESVSTSLFSGFFIGFGYALQPYIVSLLAGATFHTGSMFSRHGKKVMFRVQGEEYELDHVGLLHVCGTNTEGWETYFPNSMLASTPISIKRVKIN